MGINFSKFDEYAMQQALLCADLAEAEQEVPIGAVLVKGEEIIARAWNQPIQQQDPTAHAEINVLRLAGKKLSNYRLINTTLYVTVEPCVMCLGALVHARVSRCIYGAKEPKTGAVISNKIECKFNHQIDFAGGLYAEESAKKMVDFFRANR
jgi:tRNA(adenine34) deaminase